MDVTKILTQKMGARLNFYERGFLSVKKLGNGCGSNFHN